MFGYCPGIGSDCQALPGSKLFAKIISKKRVKGI